MDHSNDSERSARALATNLGFKARIVRWPDHTEKNYTLARLATDQGPETREILDNAVLLLVPSQDPDGQVLVIDHWYKTKGTALERVYPDLYHPYTGHDDNRDWFMLTQKETQAVSRAVYHEWLPQVWLDEHRVRTRRRRAVSAAGRSRRGHRQAP